MGCCGKKRTERQQQQAERRAKLRQLRQQQQAERAAKDPPVKK